VLECSARSDHSGLQAVRAVDHPEPEEPGDMDVAGLFIS